MTDKGKSKVKRKVIKKKYVSEKYKASMEKEIIKRFSEGETRQEFCAVHSISEETFSLWLVKIPEFEEAYKIAKVKAESWYLKIGREHMIEEHEGPRLNMGMYNRTMNTRFNLPAQRKLKVKGLASKKKIHDKMGALLKSIEDGELTSLEAVQISRVVESVVKINEHSELEERISQIEQAQKIGAGDEDFEEVKD